MMTREEFYSEVEQGIRAYLPEEYQGSNVSIMHTLKQNDTERTSLSIRMPEETICPVIYLESYFDEYEKGKTIDSILKEISMVRINSVDDSLRRFDYRAIMDYSFVQGRLQTRLYDTESNTKKLKELVHKNLGDFSAAYSIDMGGDANHSMAVMVRPELFKNWGITPEKLHEDSLKADLGRNPRLCSLFGLIECMPNGRETVNYLENPELYTKDMDMPMLVLTNGSSSFGSSLIIHPDIQEKIAECMGVDYYVLPSSVHEVIIVPADGSARLSVRELNDMVRQINETQVAPEERLSDKVQYYDSKKKVLVNAARHEQEKMDE